jgi:hypothetical protein
MLARPGQVQSPLTSTKFSSARPDTAIKWVGAQIWEGPPVYAPTPFELYARVGQQKTQETAAFRLAHAHGDSEYSEKACRRISRASRIGKTPASRTRARGPSEKSGNSVFSPRGGRVVIRKTWKMLIVPEARDLRFPCYLRCYQRKTVRGF